MYVIVIFPDKVLAIYFSVVLIRAISPLSAHHHPVSYHQNRKQPHGFSRRYSAVTEEDGNMFTPVVFIVLGLFASKSWIVSACESGY